jgi:galactose mutarotase-like enzyme
MPASFGYHPALRWPLPFGHERSEHFIDFEHEEPAPVRRLDSNGLLSDRVHRTPICGRRLALADALFRDDALILDQIRSRSVLYGAPQGPRLRVSFPDTPYLGIWTKPGARFICIEPWHGLADPEGFAEGFVAKPGVFQVAPAGTKSIEMSLALLSAPPIG